MTKVEEETARKIRKEDVVSLTVYLFEWAVSEIEKG